MANTYNIDDLEKLAANNDSHKMEVQSFNDDRNYYIEFIDLRKYIINNLNLPNTNFVGINDSQTLTNKTISAGDNTITEISDTNIKNGANINANKIGSGEVSNTEFNYLKGVGANIQSQINNLKPATATMLLTSDSSKQIGISEDDLRNHLGIENSLQYSADWTSFEVATVTKRSTGVDEAVVNVTREYTVDNSVEHLSRVIIGVGSASTQYYVRILNIKFKDARLGYNTGSIT
jgi:hypothetical protein